MWLSLLFRFLKIVVAGVICSLPIYLRYIMPISDNAILIISFTAFMIVTCYDSYKFSKVFRKRKDYYYGLLLPLLIYIFLGVLTRLFFPPIVFNRIFLPLRFAGLFGLETLQSIFIFSVINIGIVTIARTLGVKKGLLNKKMKINRMRVFR